MTINGVEQALTAVAALDDASGRERVIRGRTPSEGRPHGRRAAGAAPVTKLFRVTTASGELKLSDLLAFPNPFGVDGTAFSFTLLGLQPADVKISVMTVSGR